MIFKKKTDPQKSIRMISIAYKDSKREIEKWKYIKMGEIVTKDRLCQINLVFFFAKICNVFREWNCNKANPYGFQ